MSISGSWLSGSLDQFREILDDRLAAVEIHEYRLRDHRKDSRQKRPDPFLGILLTRAFIDGSSPVQDRLLADVLIAAGCKEDSKGGEGGADGYVGFRVRQYQAISDGKWDASRVDGELRARYPWIREEFAGHHEQWASYKYMRPSGETVEYLDSLAESMAGIARRILEL
jgi:hypothetical protein